MIWGFTYKQIVLMFVFPLAAFMILLIVFLQYRSHPFRNVIKELRRVMRERLKWLEELNHDSEPAMKVWELASAQPMFKLLWGPFVALYIEKGRDQFLIIEMSERRWSFIWKDGSIQEIVPPERPKITLATGAGMYHTETAKILNDVRTSVGFTNPLT